jgi:5,5'-dehydrodivanillate O-demethylase
MMSQEQNDRLTLVGPDRPMGRLLRRYWQPVGVASDFDKEPVQRVRVLGENLTLYRSRSGEYGLVGERCPHRRVSLEYGIPDERGIRCPYHGWLFDKGGRCVEMPYDDRINPQSTYKDRVGITAYPVEELSGLLFAYLGPQPAPLLPRWDVLVQDGFDAMIEIHRLPCNWLQCMDNAADPMHFEYLHAELGNYTLARQGKPPAMVRTPHLKIEFDVFEYGIMKRRLLAGESEDCDDWTTGHPLLFPNILAVGKVHQPTLQFRVPIDDTHTIQFAYRTKRRKPGAPATPVSVVKTDLFDGNGKIVADNVPSQDMVAWVMQGPISDRTEEHLAASDTGVILYHKMLIEEMAKVERGEDPIGLVRDPSKNVPMIRLHREGANLRPFQSTYESRFEHLGLTAES